MRLHVRRKCMLILRLTRKKDVGEISEIAREKPEATLVKPPVYRPVGHALTVSSILDANDAYDALRDLLL
jgi:hypothetical protein